MSLSSNTYGGDDAITIDTSSCHHRCKVTTADHRNKRETRGVNIKRGRTSHAITSLVKRSESSIITSPKNNLAPLLTSPSHYVPEKTIAFKFEDSKNKHHHHHHSSCLILLHHPPAFFTFILHDIFLHDLFLHHPFLHHPSSSLSSPSFIIPFFTILHDPLLHDIFLPLFRGSPSL